MTYEQEILLAASRGNISRFREGGRVGLLDEPEENQPEARCRAHEAGLSFYARRPCSFRRRGEGNDHHQGREALR